MNHIFCMGGFPHPSYAAYTVRWCAPFGAQPIVYCVSCPACLSVQVLLTSPISVTGSLLSQSFLCIQLLIFGFVKAQGGRGKKGYGTCRSGFCTLGWKFLNNGAAKNNFKSKIFLYWGLRNPKICDFFWKVRFWRRDIFQLMSHPAAGKRLLISRVISSQHWLLIRVRLYESSSQISEW